MYFKFSLEFPSLDEIFKVTDGIRFNKCILERENDFVKYALCNKFIEDFETTDIEYFLSSKESISCFVKKDVFINSGSFHRSFWCFT